MHDRIKKRVFSGIQPTGSIHIGNYLGAIRQWKSISQTYESIFCIVDLHAITVHQDPKELHVKIRELAAILMACGIEPAISPLFIQSRVSAHTELTWILDCMIPMGWIRRMTQFKEKSETQKKEATVGLFNYPALMAADILLYQTDLVPTGEDQKQHLEFTRDVAQRFNSIYGKTFRIPEPIIPEDGARIMGLDDPTKKMSKSETGVGHAINILDTPEEIYLKITGATTDSMRDIRFDQSRPGLYNLLQLYKVFSGFDYGEIENRFWGKGYKELKKELAEIIIESLRPVQSRFREITADMAAIEKILETGAARVEPTAQETLNSVKHKIGLG